MNSNISVLSFLAKLINEHIDIFIYQVIRVIVFGITKGYVKIRKIFKIYIKENLELNEDFK